MKLYNTGQNFDTRIIISIIQRVKDLSQVPQQSIQDD